MPTKKNPEKPICAECGSDDVRADAYAAWSVETQQWEIVTTFDNSDCEECGGECSLKWVDADHQREPTPTPEFASVEELIIQTVAAR